MLNPFMQFHVDGTDFQYLGGDQIRVGRLKMGGFLAENTILLDPATKEHLTLRGFEQICHEWIEDRDLEWETAAS